MKPLEFQYQRFAREKILRKRKTAVIAPPGAGKTRPIVEGVLANTMGPILIICSGPAIATWKRQIPLWGDDPAWADEIRIVTGSKPDRHAILQEAVDIGGIFIMNAAVFRLDFPVIEHIKWGAVIADEYHKYMLRRKSQTYTKFLKLTRHMGNVVLATGSVVRRDPSSMFTCFQILDPKIFRSYWKFVNTFCLVEDGYFGKEIVGVRNVEQLQELMDRYMAYIPEEVVADQLPEGRRMRMDVDMDDEQKKIYQELRRDMLSVLDSGDLIIAQTVISVFVKLRQLLCCPRALDQSLGMGAGFEAICDELDDNPHAVIFVPFRDACVSISNELWVRGYKNVDYIRGGTSPDELRDKVDAFREHRGILICTIQYAESFDLETCKTSYFLGYDYSLDQNKQAEGRTRRAISTHEFVTWKYLCYTGTIDEELLEKLIVDQENVTQVLKRPKDLIALLKGGSHEA